MNAPRRHSRPGKTYSSSTQPPKGGSVKTGNTSGKPTTDQFGKPLKKK